MNPAYKKYILLLLSAAILAVLLRVYLGQDKPQAPPPPVRILVADQDLPQGLLLRSNEFGWREVPANAVPKDAIVQNSPAANALPGSLLLNAIGKSSLILSGNIINPTAPGFLAATLKPGLRAVSVSINEVSGNAGLIQPGDFVDLLLTQNLHDNRSSAQSVVGEIIATNMRVIAVGSSLQRPKIDGNNVAANNEARTVTLEVTPRAAAVITVATHMGDLSLSLRSFATTDPGESQGPRLVSDRLNDEGSAPLNGPVWAGDISQAVRAQPAADNREVHIIRGSTESTTSYPAPPGAAAGIQAPASFPAQLK